MPSKQNTLLFRDLRMDGAADDESRTVAISFSSESPVKRFDWYKGVEYDEILGHDAGNVDLTRLQELGVALFNHDRDKVIGAIIDPELDTNEHRCKAKIRFDTDEFAETIYQKVKAGTLRGISVGYTIDNMEIVADGKKSADGRFEGPCRIARLWTPLEASIVSVPADMNVGVGRSYGQNIDDEELQSFREYQKMRKQQEQQEHQKQLADLENLKRELEILEMEC